MKKKNLYERYLAGEIEHELTDDERRQILRGYYRECDRIREIRRTWPHKDQIIFSGMKVKTIPAPEPPESPPYPEAIRGLTCGAKTRKGTPCKRIDLWQSGRCKYHGGMSTGAKTEEGKKKCAENGKRPKKQFKKRREPAKT